MWMIGLMSTALANPAQPECVTQYGKTACGYDCVAEYGQVACAQVPWGTCIAGYGKVLCGPSTPLYGPEVEKAECISGYGELACGYSCVAEYGQVACAQTPAGLCQAESGKVTCWDPPREAAWSPAYCEPVVPDPPATCKSAYGQTVCGYRCVAEYGQVACAQTPRGVCEAAFGKVTCWDPR